MSLAKILKSLTGGKERSAESLRADLAAIDVPALEAEVDRLEGERRRLLLSGTDAELIAIDGEITAANLTTERAVAAVKELEVRIADADKREADAAIAGTEEAAKKLHAEVDADQVEIDKAADKLASMLNTHRTKLHTLGQYYKVIGQARGEPPARAPDAGTIRRNVVNRIGLR